MFPNYSNMKNELIKKTARLENLPEEYIKKGLDRGDIAIFYNNARGFSIPVGFRPLAVGKGLRVKVNANIGTSPDFVSIEKEREKLCVAIESGADAVMDLSTGGDIDKIRKMVLEESTVSVGTVPIYQAICETTKRNKSPEQMGGEHLFAVIEKHASDGVDFMTLHCGVTRKNVALTKKRLTGIVSRGGAFLARWVIANAQENPLYEEYDRLLETLKKYNVTISLGDGLRPGSLKDANDNAQNAELKTLGELVVRARKKGVSVIVEGPGHMPLNEIAEHVREAKKIIKGAPYYLLGPLVTDIAAGYDHITGAIGGAIAASAGADFLCYVTPSEHLSLPDIDDVKNGVMASRIAAHAADIAKGLNEARVLDDKMSYYRKKLNWQEQKKYALDPSKFAQIREKKISRTSRRASVCSMCGSFCAMKQG